MKEPNFFIIGAPKCGTTSLASWLGQHPNIFFSRVKEPHYFDFDFKKRQPKSWSEYVELFTQADPKYHKAVGEGSTAYFLSKVAVPKIEQTFDSAKYIVMLRNPVDMAVSLHAQRVYEGQERLKSFEDAWMEQPYRENGLRIPRACHDPKQIQYRNACRLGQQLEQLYQTVDSERVLVVYLEDIQDNLLREWTHVLSFLGLPYWDDLEFYPENRAKRWRWPWVRDLMSLYSNTLHRLGLPPLGWGLFRRLKRVSLQQADREPLSDPLRRELIETFSDDIDRLAKLTGRDLSHWKELP